MNSSRISKTDLTRRGKKEPDKTRTPLRHNTCLTTELRNLPQEGPNLNKVALIATARVKSLAAMMSKKKTKMKATLMSRKNQAQRKMLKSA